MAEPSDSNPYAAPRTPGAEVPPPQPHSWARTTFFAINAAAAGLLVASWVFAIAAELQGEGDPYDFVAAVLLAPIVAIYLAAECTAFFGRRRSLERILGFINAGFGLLMAFGFVTNTYEAVTYAGDSNWGVVSIVLAVLLVITAYLLACGWFRIRSTAAVH